MPVSARACANVPGGRSKPIRQQTEPGGDGRRDAAAGLGEGHGEKVMVSGAPVVDFRASGTTGKFPVYGQRRLRSGVRCVDGQAKLVLVWDDIPSLDKNKKLTSMPVIISIA